MLGGEAYSCFAPTASGSAGVAHTGVATLKIAGFEAGALTYLTRQELSHFLSQPAGSVLWNAGHGSNKKPEPGLWAIFLGVSFNWKF